MLSTLLKGIELYRALKIYINANGYHAETHDENGIEFLCITSNDCERMRILEKIMCISSRLYSITIRAIEPNNVIRMTSWIQTHNGFGKTDAYIPVIIR